MPAQKTIKKFVLLLITSNINNYPLKQMLTMNNIDKIVMVKDYGGFKKGQRGHLKEDANSTSVYFGQIRKTEKWLRTVLRKKLAKRLIKPNENS